MSLRERITNVSQRRVGDIEHNLRNPKQYTAEKQERMTAVVNEFGKVGVLLTYFDDDGVERFFDGNTRKRLDPDEVWYIAQTDLTQKEVDDLVMFYDPLAEPDWLDGMMVELAGETAVEEETALRVMLDDILSEAGISLNGVSGESKDTEPQISRADELRDKWGVELGQLWRLPSRVAGQEHRLICGDCTDEDVVDRVMMGEVAVGGVTSPPYAEQRKTEYGGVPVAEYLTWFCGVQNIMKMYTNKSASFIVNIKAHSESGVRSLYVMDLVLMMVRNCGWGLIDEYLWVSQGTPGEWKNKFKNAHEPIFHFAKTPNVPFYPENVLIEPKSDMSQLEVYGGSASKWKAGHGSSYNGHAVKSKKYGNKVLPSNVIQASSASTIGQSAAYPEKIPLFFFGAFSKLGDIWLEMFNGSGTNIIAAENLSRQCRAVEIHPPYVAVTLQRYYDAFGIEPELMS